MENGSMVFDLLGAMGVSAAKGAATALARAGAVACVEVVGNLLKERRPGAMTSAEFDILVRLLRSSEIWNSVTAQANLTDRRGIMVCGPSGAGKTSLLNALRGRRVSARSTAGIQNDAFRVGNRVRRFTDTPGLRAHGDFVQELVRNPPYMLCLVFAHGYLRTASDTALSRKLRQYPDAASYQTAGLDEEREWLVRLNDDVQSLKTERTPSRVQKLVVVANKAELWAGKADEVEKHYRVDDMLALTRNLVSMLCPPGVTPVYATVSSDFVGFPDVTTHGSFDRDVSAASVQLVRVLLHRMLV